ncbi:MarR family winged helix-turn-helix transcriptional regulator [Albidovulum sp.]|uniref:MarR family winged helix-turn-helix transcriptional regulator n=1 Tax=Albidovulum sp. TaxID=1872424 RepID=UPI0039B89502
MSLLTPPHESLGFLLHDASRAIRRRFEARATELGLSAAQWRCLVHLMREGPSPQARLAGLLEIEPISISRLLDRMQDGGWITREADPADRRVRIVTATPRTCAAFSEAKKIAEAIYADALAGLPPGTRETLMTTLGRIIANLSPNPESQDAR